MYAVMSLYRCVQSLNLLSSNRLFDKCMIFCVLFVGLAYAFLSVDFQSSAVKLGTVLSEGWCH